jgi:hypothetical protein
VSRRPSRRPWPRIGVTILGLAHTFRTIEETANPTPDELSSGIYLSWLGLPAAFVFSALGLVLIVVSRRRKRSLDDLEREDHDELTA